MSDLELKHVLQESSMPYLAAPEGMWLNSDGIMLEIEKMPQDYLLNCYRTLQREKEHMKRGFFISGVDYCKDDYEEIIQRSYQICRMKMCELAKEIAKSK